MLRLLLALPALCLAAGCASQPDRGSGADQPKTHTLHVVRHGWHTGIVVRAADVPRDAWPARADFPGAEYFEVGWGDRDFYRLLNPNAWHAIKALFWPTPSALHVVAFDGPVERYFTRNEIVRLPVTANGVARLVAYVRESHEFDAQGRALVLGPGLYGASLFYGSHERFHLFKTCNVWTARVLREAGVPVAGSISADWLLSELRRFGTVIRARSATPPYSIDVAECACVLSC